MSLSQTLHVASPDEWRAWLANHHEAESEIWLIFFKKHTGQPGISYDHAVEEALCFGWIDSIVRRIDDARYAQKFTPRRDAAKWSASNRRRVRTLIRDGRMTEAGLARIAPGVLDEEPPVRPGKEHLEIPRALEQALMASPKAWTFFQSLAPSYRRNAIGWIMAAKREETRARRLQEVVSLFEQNQKLGLK